MIELRVSPPDTALEPTAAPPYRNYGLGGLDVAGFVLAWRSGGYGSAWVHWAKGNLCQQYYHHNESNSARQLEPFWKPMAHSLSSYSASCAICRLCSTRTRRRLITW